MKTDIYGNAVSTTSQEAISKFNQALELIRTFHGDPVTLLDQAIDADGDFSLAWTTRASLMMQGVDAAYGEEIARSLRAAAAGRMNEREGAHFHATMAFASGRYHEGTTAFGRIAMDHPRDLLALQTAHGGCFFTGRQADLRDMPLQAMRAWKPEDEGYHAVLGMAAFGLEECGDYSRAHETGTAAVDLEPLDAWAVHAVAHVHEMRGDIAGGTAWLTDTSAGWSAECGFSYHNWWHLGLLHLDAGDHAAALKLYDEKIRPNPDAQILMEWIDASSMLWRLYLEGVDVGDRFAPLAKVWERTIADGTYAFNDLHAVMAFIGAGRMSDAHRVLETLRRAADAPGDNAHMAMVAGGPATKGFIAFAEGRHAEAVDLITSIRGVAQQFGGSHAQRDVLSLTALHAAIRGGMKDVAEALSAERLAHKPQSPWARRLAQRAMQTGGAAMAAE